MGTKTAFVTGASRGIGKAIALRLAQGGYDVAITARSLEENEAREHSNTARKSDTSPLPGGLNTTAEAIRGMGRRALPLPADLLDLASVGAAADAALAEWGRIDVLVHAGRFIGPGLKDWTLETPVDTLQKHMQANAMAPAELNLRLLPAMIENGGGTVIHITSNAAYDRPFATVDKGGWGLSYAMSKAAGHVAIGVMDREYRSKGIRAFNLQPGATLTERIEIEMGDVGHEHLPWEPVEVPAEIAHWLVTAPEADAHRGKTVQAQPLCIELGLLPDWRPKEGTLQRNGLKPAA